MVLGRCPSSLPTLSPGAHTRIPRERPRSREVSKICAHAESSPLFHLSASLLPSSSSPCASCASRTPVALSPKRRKLLSGLNSGLSRKSFPFPAYLLLLLSETKQSRHQGRAYPPTSPKELKLVVFPDFQCQKVRSGLKPPWGYVCTLTMFPETLPVPCDLQKPSQQNANPSNFGELKCMCVREGETGRGRGSIAQELEQQLQEHIWKRGKGG